MTLHLLLFDIISAIFTSILHQSSISLQYQINHYRYHNDSMWVIKCGTGSSRVILDKGLLNGLMSLLLVMPNNINSPNPFSYVIQISAEIQNKMYDNINNKSHENVMVWTNSHVESEKLKQPALGYFHLTDTL